MPVIVAPICMASVVGVVAVLALLAGSRSRRWWLAAGALVFVVAFGALWILGSLGARPGTPLLVAWLTCVVVGSLAAPVLLGSTPMSSRMDLLLGVLIGGLGGGVFSFVVLFTTTCLFSSEQGKAAVLSTGMMLGPSPVAFAPRPGLPHTAARYEVRLALPPGYQVVSVGDSASHTRSDRSSCPAPTIACRLVGPDGSPFEIQVAAFTSDGRRFNASSVFGARGGIRFELHPPLWPASVPARLEIKASRVVPVWRITWWNGERLGCAI